MKHEIQSYLQDNTHSASIFLGSTRAELNAPEPNHAQVAAALESILDHITRCVKTLRQEHTGKTTAPAPGEGPHQKTVRRNS